MLRICRIWCLAVILTAPVGAQQQATSLPTVEWSISQQGEILHIDAKTTSNQAPVQRAASSPAYLEVSFPKTKLSGAASNRVIERGLIQRVQTSQDGDATLVRVFFLTKPKTSLSKTGTGYRYTVRISEPAVPPSAVKPGTPPPARQTQTITPPATAAQPPATQAQPAAPPAPTPQVAPQAAPPAAAKPPVAEPAAVTKPPAAQPAATTAAAPPTAAPTRGPQTPISVVFKDTPLLQALKDLAERAGYTAQLDPKLSGSVNLSLSEVPFEQAVGMLLQPYGDGVQSHIGGSSLTVSKATRAVEAPVSESPMVSEYYPFSTKDAQKMMDAARKAVPGLTYKVDPVLNILMVQGPREDVARLGELLKSMSNK